MSIFQLGQIKPAKAFRLLLVAIASVTLFTPAQAHDSLKTVLSKRVVGKTVILTVRDMETGKIETITGQTGRDSLVVMKDPAKASLPTKPIERVRAGQWVPTRNPVTGRTEYKKVKRTFVHTVPTMVALRLADAKTGRVVETLRGTPEHPFFTTDKGMVGMGHLRVGERVISRTGPALRVASVVPESKPGGFKVYNFEVADDHTYFVGKANGGTWVHNACTIGELKDAYNAATAPYKGGPLTVAGRALAKHNPISRPGSAFPIPTGNPAAVNDLAHEVVGEILSNPGTVKIPRGGVYDIVAPDGRGLRFNADGTLKGFLEP